MPFDHEAVKDILRCPVTQAELIFVEDDQGQSLVSLDPDSRLRFPIIDGVPVLLAAEATTMNEDEWQQVTSGGEVEDRS
ncbi:Trm112 family protein [Calycomorphotria hydatis]|uniref:Uncharacterized protein n=1 Tax=Calycomorphotria hydatis TaxID=2528027 RepID=A0A517TAY6_9PLAN|nr:hypothetical protein [Calycomorphotria hydatis]QDT65541.1 hypothetical protein V22_27960 [Calycomorphotria hydatis]